MRVIAFVGPKGSGKDTCADILKKNKKVSRTVSFALPLKRVCSEVFEVPMALLSDPVLKEKELKEHIRVNRKHLRKIKEATMTYVDPAGEGTFYNPNKATLALENRIIKTPRELLQLIGTEFIRNEIYADWHCAAAFSDLNLTKVLKGNSKANSVISVTDTRFTNEYDFLKNKFGEAVVFYYVDRPEAEAVLDKATHESELQIKKVKELILASGGEVIDNSGSLEDLEKKLKDVKIPEKVSKDEGTVKKGRFVWKKVN